jgi:hypothetical protein
VTTTPVINLSAVSTTLAITENPWQGLITGVNNTGNKFFPDVVDTAEQLIAGVVDTGDKHSFAIISANFQKNSKLPHCYTRGPGGHWFMKKTGSQKSRVRLPLKGQ